MNTFIERHFKISIDFAVNEVYKEQIIENCNNYIILRQNSGVNADYWANIIGTRERHAERTIAP